MIVSSVPVVVPYVWGLPQRVGQSGKKASLQALAYCSPGHEHVAAVVEARKDSQLAGHSGRDQSAGVLDVLVSEQIL